MNHFQVMHVIVLSFIIGLFFFFELAVSFLNEEIHYTFYADKRNLDPASTTTYTRYKRHRLFLAITGTILIATSLILLFKNAPSPF